MSSRAAVVVWTEQQKLLASDGLPSDFFGSAALDGDMAIIIGGGSAYAFQARRWCLG